MERQKGVGMKVGNLVERSEVRGRRKECSRIESPVSKRKELRRMIDAVQSFIGDERNRALSDRSESACTV